MRVLEAVVVALMSACSAFGLIYFCNDCRPLGSANITHPLQVRAKQALMFYCTDANMYRVIPNLQLH